MKEVTIMALKTIAKHGDLKRERLNKAFLLNIKDRYRYEQSFRAYTGVTPSAESVSTLTK
jgi:hypothetical protein